MGTRAGCIVVFLAMLVAGCRSAEPTASVPSLTGTSWVAEMVDGEPTVPPARPTVTFDTGGRIAGKAPCNRYFATVQTDRPAAGAPGSGTLRITPLGLTRMACEPAIMEQETRFVSALGGVTGFRREGDKLLLLDSSARVRVRLAPSP